MNKKILLHLFIGIMIGLILSLIAARSTRCVFDNLPKNPYLCNDLIEISAPILSFIIPIIISYLLYKKYAS